MPNTTPTLRDRIADAFRGLNEGGGTLADLDEEGDVYALADAVLAVLPKPVPARLVLGTTDQQQAPARFCGRSDCLAPGHRFMLGGAVHTCTGKPEAAPVPVDRAAVLREAADALDSSDRLRDFTDDHMSDVNAAANELRRMADEAQQPCVHPQGYEGECPCPTSCVCCTATAADEAQQPETGVYARDPECETGDVRTCTTTCTVHGEPAADQPETKATK